MQLSTGSDAELAECVLAVFRKQYANVGFRLGAIMAQDKRSKKPVMLCTLEVAAVLRTFDGAKIKSGNRRVFLANNSRVKPVLRQCELILMYENGY